MRTTGLHFSLSLLARPPAQQGLRQCATSHTSTSATSNRLTDYFSKSGDATLLVWLMIRCRIGLPIPQFDKLDFST